MDREIIIVTVVRAIEAFKVVTTLLPHTASGSKQLEFRAGPRFYFCSEYGSCGHASFRIRTQGGLYCQ